MKVLVIGGGGREHAIVKKLKESKKVSQVYCLPGNAGIAEDAICVGGSPTDFEKIKKTVFARGIKLVVVAPDDPLYLGLVDELHDHGVRAFGPEKAAARLEGSKVHSKNFMRRHGIPTADYEYFADYSLALNYVKKCSFPLVI